MRALFALATATLLLTGSLPVAALTYRVDPQRSELVVRVFKAGYASGLAHDHVVAATRYSGTVRYRPDDLAASSVEVEVDATALRVDAPALREEHGLEKGVGEKDRRKIQATMEGDKQLRVQEYPTISLKSTGVETRETGELEVTADLTFLGITRSVTFPVQVEEEGGGTLHATGSFWFRQSDWGLRPYSFMLGAVKNRDEVELVFDVTAVTPRDDP
jgi:polyisoprenoid-binding protein YceI